MKRDPDILRAVLEYFEQHAQPGLSTRLDREAFRFPGEQVEYHFRLLLEAGYIRGRAVTNACVADELTWDGHEYLDSLRRPNDLVRDLLNDRQTP